MTNSRSVLIVAAVPAVLMCMAVCNGYDPGELHYVGGPALDEVAPAEVAPDASVVPPSTDNTIPEKSAKGAERAASESEGAQQQTLQKDEPESNPIDAEQAPGAEAGVEADTASPAQKQSEDSDAETADRIRASEFDREKLRRRLREAKRREYGLAGRDAENDAQQFRRQWDRQWPWWRYEHRNEDGGWVRVWPREAPSNGAAWHRRYGGDGIGWRGWPGRQGFDWHRGWFRRDLHKDELSVYPRRDQGFERSRRYRGYDGPWPWETDGEPPDIPDDEPQEDKKPSQDIEKTSV